jgi:drug/metabolite transporter (DMT)-like permease
VAAVAVYTNPIMIALLSAVLIGEAVTGRQWGGVLLGFLGFVAFAEFVEFFESVRLWEVVEIGRAHV